MKKLFLFVLFISIITSIAAFGAEDPWRFTNIIAELGQESISVEENGFDSSLDLSKFCLSAHINFSRNALLHLNWTGMRKDGPYGVGVTISQRKGGLLLNLRGVFVVGVEISDSSALELGGIGWDYDIDSKFKLGKIGLGSYFTNNMWYFVGVFGVNHMKSLELTWIDDATEAFAWVNEERFVKGFEGGILLGRAPWSKLSLYLTANYLDYTSTGSSSDNPILSMKSGHSWNAKALAAFKISRFFKLAASATYSKQEFNYTIGKYHKQTGKSVNAGLIITI